MERFGRAPDPPAMELAGRLNIEADKPFAMRQLGVADVRSGSSTSFRARVWTSALPPDSDHITALN